MTAQRLPLPPVPHGAPALAYKPQDTGIVLGEHPLGPLVAAPWAGALIALGARLARHAALDGTQLVVAITVPVRDLAATLVACGWMLTRPVADLGVPSDVASSLDNGTPVRMVTGQYVIAGKFFGTHRGASGPRIRVGGTTLQLSAVQGLIPVPDLPDDRCGKRDLATPGSLVRKTGRDASWAAHQCAPTTDLAILGTKSWLAEDMTAYVGWGQVGPADKIGSILLPDTDNSPTWATRIYAAQLMQELDLPGGLSLAVLDGASAIRWLPAVESPIVMAVIDRRVADDGPSEMVMQVRSRSEPISLDALGWHPPAGVEALAFKVAL